MRSRSNRGAIAIVLHTHMPYVEGYGTWPFGEEWLWEAMASCYLPLLDVLERAPALTVSLTPVLADQLEAPGVGERFELFLTGVRRETHRRDIDSLRHDAALVAALEHSAADYERALQRHQGLEGGLLGALAPHVAWTSAATHAVLPLLATDAGIRLQLQGGIDAHRARFGEWRGGFWLPECAHAPWLDRLLAEAGVRAACVDLSGTLGLSSPENLRPLRSPDGPVLAPIDRATVELVWSAGGYPSHARYRDYHARTEHHHHAWANDGTPYDPAAAGEQARVDARRFAKQVRLRLDDAGALGEEGLVVCALDTELLGHWWYEGVQWLEFVVGELDEAGVALVALDDALDRRAPRVVALESVTTWGEGRDLSTWSGPAVADLTWAARTAELCALRAGPALSDAGARELAALQSSDWAFLVSRDLAPPYGRERAALHRAALEAELAGVRGGAPRHLAAHVRAAPLRS